MHHYDIQLSENKLLRAAYALDNQYIYPQTLNSYIGETFIVDNRLVVKVQSKYFTRQVLYIPFIYMGEKIQCTIN